MNAIPQIVVVGSLNADFTAYVKTLPQPGQTLTSERFVTVPGGKGANQAVAAAKLGATVSMYGYVGDDSNASMLLDSLKNAGVSATHVMKTEVPTGLAMILVEEAGENEIVVVPGANGSFTKDALCQMDHSTIQQANALLIQHEIPMETVVEAARIASQAGARVILNPAPYKTIPSSLLTYTNVLILNETELQQLSADIDIDSMSSLFDQGIEVVLETRGSEGVVIHTREGSEAIPACQVKAIDAVGAGDTFVAAFAVAYTSGKTLRESVIFANRAAAISTTRVGAQASFPTLQEVLEMGVTM